MLGPMVHGRSPLGYLRQLRILVVLIPLLTLAAMSPRWMGPSPPGATLNPDNSGELEAVIVPLWVIAIAGVWAVRIMVSPRASKPLRYVAVCMAYLLALATSFASLVFSMSGASAAWGVSGFVFGLVAISVVSLDRYARDVSGVRGEW